MSTTQTGFSTATLDDIKHGSVANGRYRLMVRDHFGIEGFGVNIFRAVEAGGLLINEHSESSAVTPGQEELYVVLTGHARFTVDGEEIDAPTGTLLFVRPGITRSAVADEADTSVLVTGGAPGEAYNKTPNFLVAPMFAAYQEGDIAGAAAKVREVLEEHPGMPLALFNLACMESLLGEKDAALEHLGEAIDAEHGFVDLARNDEDFDPIRNDPRFQQLIG
jgi:mannose-6-phosphate isomerase-like protein (cupin superfamily)